MIIIAETTTMACVKAYLAEGMPKSEILKKILDIMGQHSLLEMLSTDVPNNEEGKVV